MGRKLHAEKKKVVQVALPPALYEALRRRAEEQTRTVPGLLRHLIRRELESPPQTGA